MDALLSSALKGCGRRMEFSEASFSRLMYETRPYARFRNHRRAWTVAVAALLFSFVSIAAVTGVVPVPFLASTVRAKSSLPAVVASAPKPVVVPVQARNTPKVVRPPRAELRDEVERAVVNALEFLAQRQREKGDFPDQYGDSTAIPALVGMAFLSHGHLANDERYGEKICKCLDYVLGCADMHDNQPFKGYMGRPGNGRMYAHSIATLFLSECSGMVDDERQKKIDEVLPFAIKVIVDAQNQRKGAEHLGGWRYEPNSGDSDLSCSGWALMALKSARQNGAPVPDEAIEKAVLYIKRAYRESDGTFGYQGANGGNAATLSGAAILCLELCGRHLDPASLKAAKYLKGCYRQTLGNPGGSSYYGLYYTAQGLFQIGGEHWRDFDPWFRETYLKLQKPDGSWAGGDVNSSAYTTAMTVLAFTVPYRMLPIYQRDETVDY